MTDAVNQSMYVKFGPSYASGPQWLNVEDRRHRSDTKPGELLMRETAPPPVQAVSYLAQSGRNLNTYNFPSGFCKKSCTLCHFPISIRSRLCGGRGIPTLNNSTSTVYVAVEISPRKIVSISLDYLRKSPLLRAFLHIKRLDAHEALDAHQGST